MTVLEALELMLRSGIRRVYYQEGKLPRDSGSEVSLSRICATRRHMCLSLSISYSVFPLFPLASLLAAPSFLSPRSRYHCSVVPCRWKARDIVGTNGGEPSNEIQRWENSRKDRRGEVDREKRSGDNITSGTSHKTIQDSLQPRRCLQTLRTSLRLPAPFSKKHLDVRFVGDTLPSHSVLPVIAFKLFGKNFLKYNEFVFVYGRVNLYKLIWNINFIILGTDISWILYCIIIFENEFLYNFFF